MKNYKTYLRRKMSKEKTIFVCSNCGYESTKWLGKCPACNEWNSFYEEKQISTTKENNNEHNIIFNNENNSYIFLCKICSFTTKRAYNYDRI